MSNFELTPCLKISLDEDEFDVLVSKAKDWAIMHGAALRSRKAFDEDSVTVAPFTLLPSTFPRKEFLKATELQCTLNELIHKVAHDHEFLKETLKNTIVVDEFTRRLYDIYEKTREEGVAQSVSLGLLRGDYMSDVPDQYRIKQVEFNTVATSLVGLSTQISRAHRFVLQELGRADLLENLPENTALEGLCTGMIKAWEIYNSPKAAFLFIVEEVTFNICDQRFHEFFIRESRPDIRVIRRTLGEIHKQGRLDEKKRLFLGDTEVAVAYFRSGYDPAQYFGEDDWSARVLIERSKAIKCPSIHYHLAGTKKVQQALALPGAVERFLSKPDEVRRVREVFTGIFSLDAGSEGDQAVKMAMTHPERYVLKPQREGGGNNIYGREVSEKIASLKNSEERNAWILMERIHPPTLESYVIRPGAKSRVDKVDTVVSELGIFGVIIGDSKKIFLNEQCGHMLRTKLSSADEGGVSAGVGCMDSPFLTR